MQILLKNYIDKEAFAYAQESLLNNEDKYVIIELINKYLSDDTKDYYLALSETILYFFEKNSLIYLEYILKEEEEESLSDEPLDIFQECNEFLSEFKSHEIKYHGQFVNITKLFCIGYIKSFCYIFIKMHDKVDFDPEEIISKINECDKIKMVKLYIYKIIYNLCKKQMHVFLNDSTKIKYRLKEYDSFKDFIQNLITDNNNYKKIYEKLTEYQKDDYKNEITKEDINNGEINFDDFYMAANNLILSKLKQKDFETDNAYINFYQNIIEPLYKKDDEGDNDDKLLMLLQFLFEKEQYLNIKKAYEINSEDIDILQYGYRYCLNEISEEHEEEKKDYIYTSLYDHLILNYLEEKFYPGSDPKQEESYYELYNKIENHFKENPMQGCYVCLCPKGYYHSVSSGFPGFSEINLNCPACGKEIGAKEKYEEIKNEKDEKIKLHKVYETVKRENYFRIFKDKKEIDILERNRARYDKLKEINYMTKDEFKEKYIRPLYNREKGLNKIDENIFKKDNKNIRNLSQLSYRLLNYIANYFLLNYSQIMIN